VGEGHVLAAERGRTGERYLLGGENLTHRRVLEIVARVVGGREPWITFPRWVMGGLERFVRLTRRFVRFPFSPEQVWLSAREIYCDSGKAVRELGYPQTPFRVAVEEAYRWYRERGWM
jgi:dihydroflavonol-4-reductase